MRLIAGLLLLVCTAAFGQGSALLTWTPPTTNTDGTPLTNLAGWSVYRGGSPTAFSESRVLQGGATTSYVWDNLPAGTHYFVVTAINTASVESVFSNVASKVICCEPLPDPTPTPTPTPTPPPPPTTTVTGLDVGDVGAAGSATVSGGVYTVRGSGADIWGTQDEFHFAYVSLAGDGEITARLDSLTAVDLWTKAGVMIRETLTPSSRYAFTLLSAGNGADFQYRVLAGGASGPSGLNDGVTRAPYWLRLRRAGNVFTGFVSADGHAWRQQGSGVTIAMSASVYVGLAVVSHRDGTLATAAFSGVAGLVDAPPEPVPPPPPPPDPCAVDPLKFSVNVWPAGQTGRRRFEYTTDRQAQVTHRWSPQSAAAVDGRGCTVTVTR